MRMVCACRGCAWVMRMSNAHRACAWVMLMSGLDRWVVFGSPAEQATVRSPGALPPRVGSLFHVEHFSRVARCAAMPQIVPYTQQL